MEVPTSARRESKAHFPYPEKVPQFSNYRRVIRAKREASILFRLAAKYRIVGFVWGKFVESLYLGPRAVFS